MNLVDSYVLEVLGRPYFYHMWCLNVVADSYGHKHETTIYFKSEDEAKEVNVGYKFQS